MYIKEHSSAVSDECFDFSKLSRISIRMLRHYDGIGLLVPVSIDKCTGYRYYSEAQLPAINRITALKDMGSVWPPLQKYCENMKTL